MGSIGGVVGGLSLALIALGIKFFQEAFHVVTSAAVASEADMVLTVLAMIDIVLVGSLEGRQEVILTKVIERGCSVMERPLFLWRFDFTNRHNAIVSVRLFCHHLRCRGAKPSPFGAGQRWRHGP